MNIIFVTLLFGFLGLAAVIGQTNQTNGEIYYKIQNFLTPDSKVNETYLKDVLKECYGRSSESVDKNFNYCNQTNYREFKNPGLGFLFFKLCVVLETFNTDVIQNKTIDESNKFSCQLKKINFQNEDGTINKDEIIRKFAAEGKSKVSAENAINTCAVQKKTPEQTADSFLKCLRLFFLSPFNIN